ncbi:MAG: MarR family transcriptional regulator, partial [Vibrio fluvialis]
ALEIELASLMRTLNQLEEQSLITRHCCASDKRARIVSLTEQGRIMIKQMETRILQVRRQLLIHINDEELLKLGQILEQIANNALESLSEKSDNL